VLLNQEKTLKLAVRNHSCLAILAYGNHYLRGKTQFSSVANMYPGGSPAISRVAFLAAGLFTTTVAIRTAMQIMAGLIFAMAMS